MSASNSATVDSKANPKLALIKAITEMGVAPKLPKDEIIKRLEAAKKITGGVDESGKNPDPTVRDGQYPLDVAVNLGNPIALEWIIANFGFFSKASEKIDKKDLDGATPLDRSIRFSDNEESATEEKKHEIRSRKKVIDILIANKAKLSFIPSYVEEEKNISSNPNNYHHLQIALAVRYGNRYFFEKFLSPEYLLATFTYTFRFYSDGWQSMRRIHIPLIKLLIMTAAGSKELDYILTSLKKVLVDNNSLRLTKHKISPLWNLGDYATLPSYRKYNWYDSFSFDLEETYQILHAIFNSPNKNLWENFNVLLKHELFSIRMPITINSVRTDINPAAILIRSQNIKIPETFEKIKSFIQFLKNNNCLLNYNDLRFISTSELSNENGLALIDCVMQEHTIPMSKEFLVSLFAINQVIFYAYKERYPDMLGIEDLIDLAKTSSDAPLFNLATTYYKEKPEDMEKLINGAKGNTIFLRHHPTLIFFITHGLEDRLGIDQKQIPEETKHYKKVLESISAKSSDTFLKIKFLSPKEIQSLRKHFETRDQKEELAHLEAHLTKKENSKPTDYTPPPYAPSATAADEAREGFPGKAAIAPSAPAPEAALAAEMKPADVIAPGGPQSLPMPSAPLMSSPVAPIVAPAVPPVVAPTVAPAIVIEVEGAAQATSTPPDKVETSTPSPVSPTPGADMKHFAPVTLPASSNHSGASLSSETSIIRLRTSLSSIRCGFSQTLFGSKALTKAECESAQKHFKNAALLMQIAGDYEGDTTQASLLNLAEELSNKAVNLLHPSLNLPSDEGSAPNKNISLGKTG